MHKENHKDLNRDRMKKKTKQNRNIPESESESESELDESDTASKPDFEASLGLSPAMGPVCVRIHGSCHSVAF